MNRVEVSDKLAAHVAVVVASFATYPKLDFLPFLVRVVISVAICLASLMWAWIDLERLPKPHKGP